MPRKKIKKDIIEVYKIRNTMGSVDTDKLFSLFNNTRTSGHPLKLKDGRFRTEKGKYYS